MKLSIFTRIVFICLFLSTLGTGRSIAQIYQSPLTREVQAAVQAALASQPHLKFKLVTWDALTKGAITADTTQLLFGVIITNDSPVTYTGLGLQLNLLKVFNNANNNSDALPKPAIGIGTIAPILPFSSTYYQFAIGTFSGFNFSSNPLLLQNVTTNANIIEHAEFTVSLNGATPISINTSVDQVIYEPSNTNLIPTILRDVTPASTVTQKLNH